MSKRNWVMLLAVFVTIFDVLPTQANEGSLLVDGAPAKSLYRTLRYVSEQSLGEGASRKSVNVLVTSQFLERRHPDLGRYFRFGALQADQMSCERLQFHNSIRREDQVYAESLLTLLEGLGLRFQGSGTGANLAYISADIECLRSLRGEIQCLFTPSLRAVRCLTNTEYPTAWIESIGMGQRYHRRGDASLGLE